MYTPYAFIDAEHTVNHVARLITKFIYNKGRINEEVWTIFGDNKLNESMIAEQYKTVEPFSMMIRPLGEVNIV